ncbi:MAG TPA: glycosyltransferase family 39 protein [Verrucomicrobiae bacterium]|nr:glycosyltransferase family 39 protein [Verrucomicrobiae bacterium]
MQDSEVSDIRPSVAWTRRWAVVALVVVVLLVIIVRVRLLQLPLEREEGESAYAGQLLLEGIPPYKLAYDINLPGTYACYAAIMAVFGQTPAGIHLGFLLVNLGTLALLFLVARRLLDVPHAVVACISYALLSMSKGVLGLEAHATHLVVLAALGGLLLLLKARASGCSWAFAGSGLAFGLAYLCKQPGIFFGLCGLAILLHDFRSSPSLERRGWCWRVAIFCAGLALPFLLTCLLMAWAGAFDRFWFWTVLYACVHAGARGWREMLRGLVDFDVNAGAVRWAGAIAVAGLVLLARDKSRSQARFVIIRLLVFSLIAFMVGFYFSQHSFIMLLPAVSLLIAIAARRAAQAMGEPKPAVVFAAACAVFIFANRALWFEQTPEAASRALYGGNAFTEAPTIASYIQQHSGATDTIAIMGSEPEIFFLAHRHSASGYTYISDLMQPHRYALDMQKETMSQIEAAKPAFLLVIYVDTSWLIGKDSNLAITRWYKSFWDKYYDVSGMVWLLPDRTEYVWGPEAVTKTFDTDSRVRILQRKPGL